MNQVPLVSWALVMSPLVSFVGSTPATLYVEVEVLVEGPSKTSQKHPDEGPALQLMGRTHCDRIVVFSGQQRQIGQFLPVTVYDANAFTLFGAVVTQHVGPEVYSLSL